MNKTLYVVNKGINSPVTFKGYKAQYIWYLGFGLVLLLVLFAILYIMGLNPVLCLVVIIPLSGALFYYIGRLSSKYGEHGLQKKWAKKRLPKAIHSHSRRLFLKNNH